MSVEQIRTYFGIVKAFDSEEVEKRIDEENEEAQEIYNLNEDEDWEFRCHNDDVN